MLDRTHIMGPENSEAIALALGGGAARAAGGGGGCVTRMCGVVAIGAIRLYVDGGGGGRAVGCSVDCAVKRWREGCVSENTLVCEDLQVLAQCM